MLTQFECGVAPSIMLICTTIKFHSRQDWHEITC